MTGFVDFYSLVCVSHTATREEIAARIRAMLMQWHPEVCRDPYAPEMAVKIIMAKELLLNNEERVKYDQIWRAVYTSQRVNVNQSTYQDKVVEPVWAEQSWRIRQTAERLARSRLTILLDTLPVPFAAPVAVAGGGPVPPVAHPKAASGVAAIAKAEKLTGLRELWLAPWSLFGYGLMGWLYVASLFLPILHILSTIYFIQWVIGIGDGGGVKGFLAGITRVLIGMVVVLVTVILILPKLT